MSFQQKMYVAFWLSMVMAATGAVMAIRNDRAVEGAPTGFFSPRSSRLPQVCRPS